MVILHSKREIVALLNKENLTQPKVLLIEDCQFDTVLIRSILEDYYPMTLIDHASTRAKALELLENNEYDLVMLDLHLPDSKGYEDIAEFNKLAGGTPIIVATGSFDEKSLEAAKEHGADGIIGKNQLVGKDFSGTLDTAVDNIIQV